MKNESDITVSKYVKISRSFYYGENKDTNREYAEIISKAVVWLIDNVFTDLDLETFEVRITKINGWAVGVAYERYCKVDLRGKKYKNYNQNDRNLKETLKTLIHEMTHIDQNTKGRFKRCKNEKFDCMWYDKKYKNGFKPASIREYLNFPWEIEARRYTNEIIDDLMDDLRKDFLKEYEKNYM